MSAAGPAFSDPELRAAIAAAMQEAVGAADRDEAASAHWPLAVRMGWLAAFVPEGEGGIGLGLDFGADLCEEAGRALFAGPLLETAVLIPALAAEAPAASILLPGIVAGSVRVALAQGASDDVLLAQHACDASHLAILSPGDGPLDVLIVPMTAVRTTVLQATDPRCTLAQCEVETSDAIVDLHLEGGAAGRVRAALHVCVAADLLGVAAASLERTIAHVLARRQFGQPIGQFQAIKHRLADVHTAIGVARLAISGALRPSAPANDARIARVLAADAANGATRAAIQLHGGIGFSWESGLHLYLKRAMRLHALCGGTGALRAAAGEHILAEALASAD